jgi:hypothetical protein
MMENVYTEFRLEHRATNEPSKRGVDSGVPSLGAQPALFNVVWKKMQGDYNPLFGQFMNEHLGEPSGDVPMRS